jgi:hypothetical protein
MVICVVNAGGPQQGSTGFNRHAGFRPLAEVLILAAKLLVLIAEGTALNLGAALLQRRVRKGAATKSTTAGFWREPEIARNCLKTLVGAGRFERPTPCAQGSFQYSAEMACFQAFLFQADGATLLQLVEPCGTRRLSPATFLSTAV